MAALPPKLYFRIGEVAGLVGVEPHVLRYWEREFRSIRPTKSAKGQRVYSRKDVEALLVVKDLLYSQGFTIAGAKKRLSKSPAQEASVDGAPLRATDGAPSVASAAAPAPAASAPALAPASATAPAIAHAHATTLASSHVSSLASSHATAVAPVASASPAATASSGASREKLSALRSEVEAFLRELGG